LENFVVERCEEKARNPFEFMHIVDVRKKVQIPLKNVLTRAYILSFTDFSLPFYVATGVSSVGIGAVCYQLPGGEDDQKNIRYISFVARSLQERARRYSATQRKLFGIEFALKKNACLFVVSSANANIRIYIGFI
jgi:hypothetical protein